MKDLSLLIVEDDPDFAESLAITLEARGHRVTVAGSAEEALLLYRGGEHDLVLMDVRLPVMNGVEAFRVLRGRDPSAKVVMMTGYSVPELLDEARRSGAMAVLHKPFAMEELLGVLDHIDRGAIVIADDDPDFVESLARLLTERGLRVAVCRNGREVLERRRRERIDLLLLDLRMPVMDGLECFLALRAEGLQVPTILVTAFGDVESEKVERMRTLEVDRVLNKPVDPDTLVEGILAMLARPGQGEGR